MEDDKKQISKSVVIVGLLIVDCVLVFTSVGIGVALSMLFISEAVNAYVNIGYFIILFIILNALYRAIDERDKYKKYYEENHKKGI